jgi:Uma2 family endonuclease
VEEYWVIDPLARTITVYRQQAGRLGHASGLSATDTLTSPRLPGFSCPVSALFRPV